MATISAKEFLGGRPATLVGNENTPDYKRNTLQSHPTFGQNVSSAIQRRGENVYGAIAGTSPESQGESPLVRGVQATGEAFGAITDVGAEAVKSAVGLIPQGARDTATNIKEGLLARVPQKVKEIGAKAYEEVGLQLDELSQENPEMASKVESALKVGKGAGEIAGGILVAEETATGLTKGGKLLEKGAQKAKDVVSDVGGVAMDKLGNTPEKIMQRVARISKGKQAKFQQKAGESVGEYLTKRKIFGDVDGISEQLYKRFNNSKATADSALEKLPGVYKPPQVGSALQELLDREVKVSAVGAPSPDIARVSSLVDKYEKAGLTMSEINEVKRLFERNVKLDFLRQNLPQGVAKANNIDNAIRSWQVNQAKTLGLKNLPEINRETMLAKQLLDDLGKEYAGSAGNNAITLTDWIMLSGGDPTAIAGFLTKKTFSSKNVQSKIAELFSRNKESMGEIGADIGESQVKQLGAPAMGQAQKGVDVPIEMPSRKAIESGTEIVPRQSILDRDITPESVKSFESGLREDVSDYLKNPKLGMSINDVTKDMKAYKGEKDLTTKILKDLEGKTTVSKQYILDATNRGELKQVERDLIRQALESEGNTVNVNDFAKKVKAELLPLERKTSGSSIKPNRTVDDYKFTPRYENIALPDELRGKIKDYRENIYNSPIKTSAGKTHFGSNAGVDTADRYFGHTRIEDMADNNTRRVIEVQSDLYQKGNLESEKIRIQGKPQFTSTTDRGVLKARGLSEKEIDDFVAKLDEKNKGIKADLAKRQQEISKLEQYNDPTAHFRMVREEIKKAALDGKTKLQFPTGETAMKIEGLGQQGDNAWSNITKEYDLTPQNMGVGDSVVQGEFGSEWIITDVLGDGKFKAVPKIRVDQLKYGNASAEDTKNILDSVTEQFDISGKVDTNNPIYKFYEKEVSKYLNKFGGKRVVDDKGVSWIEVPITKEQGKMPVEAFGLVGALGLGAYSQN